MPNTKMPLTSPQHYGSDAFIDSAWISSSGGASPVRLCPGQGAGRRQRHLHELVGVHVGGDAGACAPVELRHRGLVVLQRPVHRRGHVGELLPRVGLPEGVPAPHLQARMQGETFDGCMNACICPRRHLTTPVGATSPHLQTRGSSRITEHSPHILPGSKLRLVQLVKVHSV